MSPCLDFKKMSDALKHRKIVNAANTTLTMNWQGASTRARIVRNASKPKPL